MEAKHETTERERERGRDVQKVGANGMEAVTEMSEARNGNTNREWRSGGERG